MKSYILVNLASGRGAYAGLTGGQTYSAATTACVELIAAGHITRDFLSISALGQKVLSESRLQNT